MARPAAGLSLLSKVSPLVGDGRGVVGHLLAREDHARCVGRDSHWMMGRSNWLTMVSVDGFSDEHGGHCPMYMRTASRGHQRTRTPVFGAHGLGGGNPEYLGILDVLRDLINSLHPASQSHRRPFAVDHLNPLLRLASAKRQRLNEALAVWKLPRATLKSVSVNVTWARRNAFNARQIGPPSDGHARCLGIGTTGGCTGTQRPVPCPLAQGAPRATTVRKGPWLLHPFAFVFGDGARILRKDLQSGRGYRQPPCVAMR
jgi:hypothetical protein